MGDVFKTLNLSDDNEIFRGYTAMIELYNALKFKTMLFFIYKILRLNLGVAFLKSVSIHVYDHYFQTSSSLKLLGQSMPNFMWSFLGKGERKFIKNGLGHMTKMAATPIYG